MSMLQKWIGLQLCEWKFNICFNDNDRYPKVDKRWMCIIVTENHLTLSTKVL